MDDIPEEGEEQELAYALHLFHECMSCTEPMIGILKPSPLNNPGQPLVARDTCWICERVEEEQARFDRTGAL